MMEKLHEFLTEKKWKNIKKSDWIVLALTGVLLLIIAMPSGGTTGVFDDESKTTTVVDTGEDAKQNQTTNVANEEEEYTKYLEEKLAQVLGEMEGVGKVAVMVTLSDTGESVVEKDRTDTTNTLTETDGTGGSRTTTEKEYATSTIYVETGEETYPYVGKEVLPTIEGVVVVAEGGGNATVVSNISDAIMALFKVEAHRIKVVKMCSQED